MRRGGVGGFQNFGGAPFVPGIDIEPGRHQHRGQEILLGLQGPAHQRPAVIPVTGQIGLLGLAIIKGRQQLAGLVPGKGLGFLSGVQGFPGFVPVGGLDLEVEQGLDRPGAFGVDLIGFFGQPPGLAAPAVGNRLDQQSPDPQKGGLGVFEKALEFGLGLILVARKLGRLGGDNVHHGLGGQAFFGLFNQFFGPFAVSRRQRHDRLV